MSQIKPLSLDRIQTWLEAERLFAVATVVRAPRDDAALGRKMLVEPDGTTEGDLGPRVPRDTVVRDAQRLLEMQASDLRSYGDDQVFIEAFVPPPRLILIGGVHTAIPLTRLGKLLGFHVTVVDGRGRFATRERFPEADEIVVDWPDEALPKLKVTPSTYVVILTHDPKFDLPALEALSKMRPRYIGAMGSRETRRAHFNKLRQGGVPDEFLQSVYGPVGLDLGARTPEEMAVAIMAEIIAVRYNRRGGHLKGQ